MKQYLDKTYYTASELEQLLPVTRATISQWTHQGKIKPDLLINRNRYYLKETIEQFIKVNR